MTRSSATMAALLVVAGVLCAAFIGLGVWQIERLSWKRALIARVEARVHAPPVAAPGPERWASLGADRDGYRHIAAVGRYRDDATVFVQAVTERGPGFWAMTPLLTDRGFTGRRSGLRVRRRRPRGLREQRGGRCEKPQRDDMDVTDARPRAHDFPLKARPACSPASSRA